MPRLARPAAKYAQPQNFYIKALGRPQVFHLDGEVVMTLHGRPLHPLQFPFV